MTPYIGTVFGNGTPSSSKIRLSALLTAALGATALAPTSTSASALSRLMNARGLAEVWDGKCSYLGLAMTNSSTPGWPVLLEGHCTDSQGTEYWSTISLPDCIGFNGKCLIFENHGDYNKVCEPCLVDTSVDPVVFRCQCVHDNIPIAAHLKLGNQVNNPIAIKLEDGKFKCGGTVGTKSLGRPV